MKKTISKTRTKETIEKFFFDIENKTPEQVKKIKKLAMTHNLKLKEFKNSFCKKCFFPYKNPKIRIKNKIKSITCGNCGYVFRKKLKN